MPPDRRCCWTLAEAEEGVPSEGMQALRFWLSLRANSSLVCESSYVQGISIDPEAMLQSLLVIFPGVLNLGDADARGTLAGEPKQFIAGDFITQFLGNQGRSIGTHGLQHLLSQRRIAGDVCKKLPELVRAHAAGNVELILTGLALPLAC